MALATQQPSMMKQLRLSDGDLDSRTNHFVFI